MLMLRKVLLTLVCAAGLSACLGLQEVKEEPRMLFGDHVLNERIWDVQGQQFVTREQLLKNALQSDYLLLGETHDNLLHHQYQQWVIDGVSAAKRTAAVSFEMIMEGQAKLLAEQPPASADDLISLLNQVNTTWGYERNYRQIFASVLKAGYSIHAASPDRETLMNIARHGEENISAPIQAVMERSVLNAEQEAGLLEEIEQSHCGMLPEKMANIMVMTQRVKDAIMTESLTQQTGVDVHILVAGSGHGRTDRAVPWYLRQEAPGAKVVSIAWMEVVGGVDDIKEYANFWGGKQLPFDYVWFTARVDRPDPCEAFKKHMHKKHSDVQQDKPETGSSASKSAE